MCIRDRLWQQPRLVLRPLWQALALRLVLRLVVAVVLLLLWLALVLRLVLLVLQLLLLLMWLALVLRLVLLLLLLLLLLLQWLLLGLPQAVNRRPKGDRGNVAAGDLGEGWQFYLVALLQPLGGLLWLLLLLWLFFGGRGSLDTQATPATYDPLSR